jgi:hypothetical protein
LQKFAYAIRRFFVVPAKAGIQGERHERALDPRFRGGDDTFGNLRKAPRRRWPRSPTVGQHNAEIYRGRLGLSPEEVEGLKGNGVI